MIYKIIIEKLSDKALYKGCKISVKWKDKTFAIATKTKEISNIAIQTCINTVALLEKFGEKALDKDGDISMEFVRTNAPTKEEIDKIQYEIINRTNDATIDTKI